MRTHDKRKSWEHAVASVLPARFIPLLSTPFASPNTLQDKGSRIGSVIRPGSAAGLTATGALTRTHRDGHKDLRFGHATGEAER